VNGNGTAVDLYDALGDTETETIATSLLGPRAIHTKERLKEARDVTFGNSRTIIGDADDDVFAVLSSGNLYGTAVGQRVLDSVLQKISNHGPHPVRINLP
jgi:hypothetical protein